MYDFISLAPQTQSLPFLPIVPPAEAGRPLAKEVLRGRRPWCVSKALAWESQVWGTVFALLVTHTIPPSQNWLPFYKVLRHIFLRVVQSSST